MNLNLFDLTDTCFVHGLIFPIKFNTTIIEELTFFTMLFLNRNCENFFQKMNHSTILSQSLAWVKLPKTSYGLCLEPSHPPRNITCGQLLFSPFPSTSQTRAAESGQQLPSTAATNVVQRSCWLCGRQCRNKEWESWHLQSYTRLRHPTVTLLHVLRQQQKKARGSSPLSQV